MMLGWSKHEKSTYPYYMHNNKVFTLYNNEKALFFSFTEGCCKDIVNLEITKSITTW